MYQQNLSLYKAEVDLNQVSKKTKNGITNTARTTIHRFHFKHF